MPGAPPLVLVLDGNRHGKGTETYANGNKYEGDYVDGKQHGKGTKTWANGTVFHSGAWENGKKAWTLGSQAPERWAAATIVIESRKPTSQKAYPVIFCSRPFFTVAWSEGTWLRPHHRTRYLQVSGSILSTQRKERPQYTQMHTRTHIHREIRVREASQVKREKEGEKGPPRASRQRKRMRQVIIHKESTTTLFTHKK